MARIFKTPFGAQGDTEQVPEAPQGDGSVSLTQGFGYDYEREYEDPAAKDIRREVMNGLFHDITEAIGDIQLSGIAKWSADAAPYPAGAEVWHNSAAWMSTAGNNSSEPGEGSWKEVDLSSSIRLSEPIDQVPSANNVQQALAGIGAFSGDGYQNIAVFDTAGVHNWTVPDVLSQGLRKTHVTVIGGGGGGARRESNAGGGGGGGGVAEDIIDLTGFESIPITVGEGGQGAPSGTGNQQGGSGGTTSFGEFVSATGGEGATSGGTGGWGGSGSGGVLTRSLGGGSANSVASSGQFSGGKGAFALRGESRGEPGTGPSGASPGAGGSGGILGGAGGNGRDGIVIVRW